MRTLHTDMANAIKAPVVRWIWFVKLGFDSGDLGWSTAHRPITYDGLTYLAAGPLGTIGAVAEDIGVKSRTISVTLSGIKSEVVALLLGEPYINRPAAIYAAVSDANWSFDTNKIKLVFRGTMDSISGETGNTASFTVEIKSRLADWERERKLLYSDSDQQRLFPGDNGFNFVPQLSQRQIIWPQAAFFPDPRG